MRVISYGGGVQSTALVVLAATGRIDADVALFANVGDRAEHPATLAYVHDIAQPWAADHGLDIVELRRAGDRDLYDDLVSDRRSIDIPVRMATGAFGHRKCTDRYKIAVVSRWLRTHDGLPADVLIGFSTDEIDRVGRRRPRPGETAVYPLLDLGLSRNACRTVILAAGLPVPPKSACWFCPYKSSGYWAETRRDHPARYTAGVELEDRLNAKRAVLGRDPITLTTVPLRHIAEAQPSLFDGPEGCDDGYCWT